MIFKEATSKYILDDLLNEYYENVREIENLLQGQHILCNEQANSMDESTLIIAGDYIEAILQNTPPNRVGPLESDEVVYL